MILWGGFGVQRSLDAETLLWDAQVITDGRLTLSFQRQRESGFFCEACCLTPRHLSLASRDLTLIACWTAFVERRMPPPPPLSPSPAQDIYDSRLFSPPSKIFPSSNPLSAVAWALPHLMYAQLPPYHHVTRTRPTHIDRLLPVLLQPLSSLVQSPFTRRSPSRHSLLHRPVLRLAPR